MNFIRDIIFLKAADELTSPSVFSLLLTVGSKSYGFSLSKLEKQSSESEELKEVSLDNKLESLRQLKLTKRYLNSDYCELTSPSVFSLLLTVGSKSYGFSLSKLEKLSSESEELKEASLDNKLESLRQLKLTKRHLNSDYRKVKNFFFCPQTCYFVFLHFATLNYFNQILRDGLFGETLFTFFCACAFLGSQT